MWTPSGRLPCTFPRSPDHLPFFHRDATAITYDLWHGYRKLDRDRVEPAFPFGFGLSYTTFAYGDLRLDRAELGPADRLGVEVDVTNTGAHAGEDVVQLYVSALGSRVPRVERELKAFTRVALAPGETKTVRMELPTADLAYWDESIGWVVEPIAYEVAAMRHERDERGPRARFRVRA